MTATVSFVGFVLLMAHSSLAEPAVLLMQVRSGPPSYLPHPAGSFANVLYFAADDGVHGNEIWRSDGTTSGTYLVEDIRPGPQGSIVTSEPTFVAIDEVLFFAADDGNGGAQIWKIDAPTGEVDLLTRIAPDQSSAIGDMRRSDEHLLFTVITGFFSGGIGEQFLWSSDGTPSGTHRLYLVGTYSSDPFSGSAASYVGQLIPLGDLLLATQDSFTECCLTTALVRLDSSGVFPSLYRNTQGPPFPPPFVRPFGFTELKGEIWFMAQPFASSLRCSIYRSNGASAVPVNDLESSCYSERLVALGDAMFAVASHGAGSSIVRINSEGTVANPITPEGVLPTSGLVQSGRRLCFTAVDGRGEELWSSDGTALGTYLVHDINSGPQSSAPVALTDVNGTLVFFADDGQGTGVWKTDGTLEGTARLQDAVYNRRVSPAPKILGGTDTHLFLVLQNEGDGRYGIWGMPMSVLATTCAGDCNDDRQVTIDDILLGVNIAIDGFGALECSRADANKDDTVTVDELVAAVNDALFGCDAHRRSSADAT